MLTNVTAELHTGLMDGDAHHQQLTPLQGLIHPFILCLMGCHVWNYFPLFIWHNDYFMIKNIVKLPKIWNKP